MWTGLAQGPNPAEPRIEGGWERTRRCQLSQGANQRSTVSETPKVVSSLCNNMGWSSVSNAALRSSKASTETTLSSAFLRRQSTTLSRDVSVLWFFLYADCLISSRLFSERLFCTWVKTTLFFFSLLGFWKWRADLILVKNSSNHSDPVQVFLTVGLLWPAWIDVGRFQNRESCLQFLW